MNRVLSMDFGQGELKFGGQPFTFYYYGTMVKKSSLIVSQLAPRVLHYHALLPASRLGPTLVPRGLDRAAPRAASILGI